MELLPGGMIDAESSYPVRGSRRPEGFSPGPSFAAAPHVHHVHEDHVDDADGIVDVASRHLSHTGHMHVHGDGCGHVAVPHEDHLDYVHGDHRHAGHHVHYDEH